MTEIIFETLINLIETFIIIDFLTRYLDTKYSGVKQFAGFLIFWCMTFTQLCFMNQFTEFEIVGALIPVVILFVYALIYLKGGVWLKLWLSAFIHLVVYIIAFSTNLIVCKILGYSPSDMISVFSIVRVISVIITKIVLFAITRIILRIRYKNPIGIINGIILIFIPSASVLSLASLMKVALLHYDASGYILTGMLCIIAADIATYYFFVSINKEYETKIRTKLLEQQNENLKNSIEDKEAFVMEMRTVRHDIKHHISTISKYVSDNNNQEALKYISSLSNDYLPRVLNYINTDNIAFDAVINSKIAICNQKNIFIELNMKKGTSINLPDAEIICLFGNLIDNAIEASEDTKEKRIAINIKSIESYLIILIENSIKSSVLSVNSALETSKEDKERHGVGIQSVKNIVNNHNGMIQFYEEENMFCCQIMLDVNKK